MRNYFNPAPTAAKSTHFYSMRIKRSLRTICILYNDKICRLDLASFQVRGENVVMVFSMRYYLGKVHRNKNQTRVSLRFATFYLALYNYVACVRFPTAETAV